MGSNSPIFELLVLFLVVHLLQIITGIAGLVGGLFVLSAPITENPWTVVTSVYAHAGLGHLLSNAIALVLFGWPVARGTTRLRFHLFFLFSGALAGITQIIASNSLASFPFIGTDPTGGVLGASGAVFALLGYLLAGNRVSSSLGRLIPLPAVVTLVIFVVVAAAVTFATASPGVALLAHFAGLLFGLLAGRVGVLNPDSSGRTSRPSRI